MCSGGGGSVTENVYNQTNTPEARKGLFGIDDGSAGVPTDTHGGSAAVPTTPLPNGNGNSPTKPERQSSLVITRQRRRASSGTASAPGGGSGLNIPT